MVPTSGTVPSGISYIRESQSLDGPNPGWLWRKVTMAVMKWKGKGVEVTSALQSTRIGIYWVRSLSIYFVELDQVVVKVAGAREIPRQLCLKLNFVWLWIGDLSISLTNHQLPEVLDLHCCFNMFKSISIPYCLFWLCVKSQFWFAQ